MIVLSCSMCDGINQQKNINHIEKTHNCHDTLVSIGLFLLTMFCGRH